MISDPAAIAGRPKAVANEATILADEVAAILSSPALRRAPILSRLLRYLLERTLAGEGDRLKAYTVAVDGLARAADFDAQLDSYPRVQIVRLRKALESYYSETPLHAGPCVYLGSGSYRLRVGERAIAYPGLVSRADAPSPTSAPVAKSTWAQSAYRLWAGLTISIAIVGLIGMAITASREAATARLVSEASAPRHVTAPMAVLGVGDGVASPQAKAAVGIMSDGLRRSWAVRVRDETVGNTEAVSPPAYRLTVRESADATLDIELIDARSGTVLWTGSEAGPGDASLRNRLAPAIAIIAGPFGVIARTETARLTDRSTGSYACLLRYVVYLKMRQPTDKARVAECLGAKVDDPQLESTLGGLRTFFTLESGVWTDRKAQIGTAERWARIAIERNGDDAYARSAMARLSYMRSLCVAGDFHAARAMAANPYDAFVVTILAAASAYCGGPTAQALLDRAYLIRNDNDAMRGFLVMATITQGQDERLDKLGFVLRPPPGPELAPYLVTESLIAAVQGRRADAVNRWAEFRALAPGTALTDEDRLKKVFLSEPARDLILKILREKGVVAS